MEVQNQWILAVHKNLNVQMATKGLRNQEVKVLMDRNQGRIGQTMDSSNKRHLSNPITKTVIQKWSLYKLWETKSLY